jgi:hypothetical protein
MLRWLASIEEEPDMRIARRGVLCTLIVMPLTLAAPFALAQGGPAARL